jgi:hypothetical protein
MKTTFISTFMLADSSRRQHPEPVRLWSTSLGVELSSGRKFDIGLGSRRADR